MIDKLDLKFLALQQIGKPYKFGAKWSLDDPDPIMPVDCSGFSRWLLYQVGVNIPDGSQAQYDTCELLNPQSLAMPGDLAFFIHPWHKVHHVGVIMDDENMVEARGFQSDQQEHPMFNAVILRPRKIWETWNEFSGYMRPQSVR